MVPFTRKEDLRLAARTLAFAVAPDAAGGAFSGLNNQIIRRRAIDSACLLTEVEGETREGMTLHAFILSFRDYPAVKLSASLENRTEHVVLSEAPIALPDMEFCGSAPCLLSGGCETKITPEAIIRDDDSEYIICTEESALAVRTEGRICLRRSPCGYFLRVEADCPRLMPGDRFILPAVLMMTAAGDDKRLRGLLSGWDNAHSLSPLADG